MYNIFIHIKGLFEDLVLLPLGLHILILSVVCMMALASYFPYVDQL